MKQEEIEGKIAAQIAEMAEQIKLLLSNSVRTNDLIAEMAERIQTLEAMHPPNTHTATQIKVTAHLSRFE